jgi:hypothetical protein
MRKGERLRGRLWQRFYRLLPARLPLFDRFSFRTLGGVITAVSTSRMNQEGQETAVAKAPSYGLFTKARNRSVVASGGRPLPIR